MNRWLPGNRGMRASHWLETARGRLFLQRERRQLKAVMPSVLGYRMLQVGRWGLSADAAGGSAILRHWILDTEPGPGVSAVVDTSQLPVASRSVDAVLLPHALEGTAHPHRLLREADRVLCERGQIILLGFNPLHPAVLLRRWPSRRPMYPAFHRLYTVARTHDWLGLLDYEIEQVRYYGLGFPWWGRDGKTDAREAGRPWAQWAQMFEGLGQGYLIFARKRVVPLTPVRQRWRERPQLGPVAMPEARVSRVTYLRGNEPTPEQ